MPSKIPASDPRDEIITHLPAMRAFALSLTRNGTRADDLVQDAIVKAWKGFDSFKPGTNPACMALYDPSKYVLLREAKGKTPSGGCRRRLFFAVGKQA